jgi:hypothetical protein
MFGGSGSALPPIDGGGFGTFSTASSLHPVMSQRRHRVLGLLVASAFVIVMLARPALAHGGGFGAGAREAVTIPTWLVLLTGGAAVGASFLLASLVTDRQLIRAIDGWRRAFPAPGRVLTILVRAFGVVALVATVAVGVAGPQDGRGNLALLVVWVGWWAGYTMTAYLAGNTWRVLNPWRTIAGVLPTLDRDYPQRVGAWPATLALLALVWLEVTSPIADAPRLLTGVVVAYTAITLAGAAVYGPESWFRRADPVARVFDHYGRVAPLARDGGTLSVRLPGVGLSKMTLANASQVAFVVALLWVTTFDGFVRTQAWASLADATTQAGVPLGVLYPAALLAGFGLFLGVFRAAARASQRVADTPLTTGTLARQFAPSLLAIAAGYHLAHYLGYFISLAPRLAVVASAPLEPTVVGALALPAWFDLVGMVAILVGHLLAIWVAHATAYDVFPGRLQAIRSQYPFIAVMVFYTMTSLWIIAQPEVATP